VVRRGLARHGKDMKEGDLELLNQIAEFEKSYDMTRPGAELGWSWRDVRVWPAILNRLFLEGVLNCPFKSNSYTGYLLSELGWAIVKGEASPEAMEVVGPQKPEIPDDLFGTIEGHDDVKSLVRQALTTERPVHLLFTGVPSSAKTMFLMELSRLGAPYILGSQATKAGIADLLFDIQPEVVLVDEIDRLGTKDIAILLSLMETGIVAETKYGKRREINLNTKVFAASNTTNMPRELLSRFLVLYFKSYTEVEFLKVAVNVLEKRENVDGALAGYIAGKVWQLSKHQFADPREAVRIARLVKSREDVDRIIEVMNRYSRVS